MRSAEDGLVDADLGGGLIKQRVARPGQGKSGGYRTVIAYRHGDLAVFLLGFAKNERANIDDDELEELKRQARVFLGLSEDQIEAAIAEDELTEVELWRRRLRQRAACAARRGMRAEIVEISRGLAQDRRDQRCRAGEDDAQDARA